MMIVFDSLRLPHSDQGRMQRMTPTLPLMRTSDSDLRVYLVAEVEGDGGCLVHEADDLDGVVRLCRVRRQVQYEPPQPAPCPAMVTHRDQGRASSKTMLS
jgi:hypothetical protein